MTNLYEKFGCKNKYELWDKLKSNDPVVKDLREFIEYAKCNIKSPFKSISSPKDFADYYSSNLKDTNLQDNEFTCVFVNTKNIPIHWIYVKIPDTKSLSFSAQQPFMECSTSQADCQSEKSL